MARKFFQLCIPIGIVLSFIFKSYTGMSDFMKGFFEGMALVFFVTGLAYYGYCFVKKQKPYDR